MRILFSIGNGGNPGSNPGGGVASQLLTSAAAASAVGVLAKNKNRLKTTFINLKSLKIL